VARHRQLRDRALGEPAEMEREARILDVREELRRVGLLQHEAVAEEREQGAPAPRAPLALEQRALLLERAAREQALDARARVDGEQQRGDDGADEPLAHT